MEKIDFPQPYLSPRSFGAKGDGTTNYNHYE